MVEGAGTDLHRINNIYIKMELRREKVTFQNIYFPAKECKTNHWSKILYAKEVVTLQKKMFNIFALENEVYTIY